MPTHLIFEETTSALYYSNDGKLRLVISNPFSREPAVYSLRLYFGEPDDDEKSEIVFSTHDRVKADAYIAGYDLAVSAA